MVLEKKSIGMCILLSVITCGIYSLYWVYTLQEDTNRLTMNNTEPTGGMVVLLDIVTCGIYGVYWSYRQGEKIDRYYASRGDSTNTNLGLLYLCLFIASYFVGFGILIGLALMQDKVNCMIDERSAYSGGQTGGVYRSADFSGKSSAPEESHHHDDSLDVVIIEEDDVEVEK